MSLIKYPLPELIASVLIVLVAAVLPWQTGSQRQSVVLFIALNIVVALLWSFLVSATPDKWRWAHLVVGIVLLLVEWLWLGRQETGILDVLLVPVGLGIIVATVCSYLRTWKA